MAGKYPFTAPIVEQLDGCFEEVHQICKYAQSVKTHKPASRALAAKAASDLEGIIDAIKLTPLARRKQLEKNTRELFRLLETIKSTLAVRPAKWGFRAIREALWNKEEILSGLP